MARIDPGNQRAVAEAKHYAAMYRRAGYPEAEACPEYCLDEVCNGYATYTVCVRLGPYDKNTRKPGLFKAFQNVIALARVV